MAAKIDIEGEPDQRTGSLEEWLQYRQMLAGLPQDDETVRLAIAVADARIVHLRHVGTRRRNGE
jgi:hypothetical protein